jgi:hypothetical protein
MRYSLFAIRYWLLPLTSLMGFIVKKIKVDFLNFNEQVKFFGAFY